MKIGIFCHMYYPELFEPLIARLHNIPAPADLFISTGSKKNRTDLVWRLVNWKGRTDIKVVENRGRDIAPKLISFRREHLSYDLVLHVHTKGSMVGRIDADMEWREYLYDHLLGSPQIVTQIIDRFKTDRKLGIVAPTHFPPIAHWINWGGNLAHAQALASRAKINLVQEALDFPSGSMFWARPAALRPLLSCGLSYSDFPEESGQDDGTIAHAIERLYYYAANSSGYGCQSFAVKDEGLAFSPCRVAMHA